MPTQPLTLELSQITQMPTSRPALRRWSQATGHGHLEFRFQTHARCQREAAKG